MRRLIVMAMLGLMLAACGSEKSTPPPAGNQGDAVATSVAATVAAGQAGDAGSAGRPTSTPDNTVATVDTNALNTSFETAAPLDGKVTASVKESTFYYKIDVPVGGIVTSTISVDSSSPGEISATIYNKDHDYLGQINAQPGEIIGLGQTFGAPDGGPVFWSVAGQATFTLEASASKQDDGGSGGDAGGEYDKAASAKAGAIKGALGGSDKYDYYVFDVPKSGGRLSVEGSATGDISFQLFDQDKNYLNQASITAAAPVSATRMLSFDQGGKWYFSVQGEGAYDLNLAFAAQNDGGSAKDAPDGGDFDAAAKVKVGAIKGEVGDDDNSDLFAFDLPKDGGTMTVTLTTAKGELQLQTFDTDRNYMDNASANTDAAAAVKRTITGERGGRWFARVDGDGAYELAIEFVPQNDADGKKDAGDDFDKALAVKGGTFGGLIGDDDRYDMFRVPAATGRNVKVVVVGAEGNADFQIFDNQRNYGPSGQAYAGSDGTATVEGADDYFIRIAGTGAYRVEITP